MGRCHRGNGTRILLLTDGNGTPLSAYTTAANHSEVTTIQTLVDQCPPHGKPRRLLYDKAADADWLREHLQSRGIELICPHRERRKRPRLQDGRSLRRYDHVESSQAVDFISGLNSAFGKQSACPSGAVVIDRSSPQETSAKYRADWWHNR
ncbi:transposase [Planctomicrobium sp. SH527]|uniref:transposase n=1 Tax=Planctomicrobium sp. SH527 TaxID=3448123 RepID=UPI003F5BD791